MYQITVKGNSPADLARKLRRLADGLSAEPASPPPHPPVYSTETPEAQAEQLAAQAQAPSEQTPAPSPAPQIAMETVRAVLVDANQAGKGAQVRALIARFGAEKLSEVDPAHYAELHAAAQALLEG